MLIAGKMMWAEIVNANCSRASSRTSLVWSIRLALLSQPHRSLLSRVDVQAEHIRPHVMTNGIEIVLAWHCITQAASRRAFPRAILERLLDRTESLIRPLDARC